MKKIKPGVLVATTAILTIAGAACAAGPATDEVIADQRSALAKSTKDAGFGPQAPRDIGDGAGTNTRSFNAAPSYKEMNLCNIHFHENAEHKGGEFTKYAGNGNGKGAGTGYIYTGSLTDSEKAPYANKVGEGKYGDLVPGDTIEVHYVHTTAQVTPGPTLGACLSKSIGNPQLRVEAQVFVIVNDDKALNFVELAKHKMVNGLHQAVNIPSNTGTAVQYNGSTTGPGYNKKGSPFQVSWSVRPEISKISISSVESWLKNNAFKEDHAHGVRNLVTNTRLLSRIKR